MTKGIGDPCRGGRSRGEVALVNAVDKPIAHRTIQVVEAVWAECADGFAFVEGAFEGGFNRWLLFRCQG